LGSEGTYPLCLRLGKKEKYMHSPFIRILNGLFDNSKGYTPVSSLNKSIASLISFNADLVEASLILFKNFSNLGVTITNVIPKIIKSRLNSITEEPLFFNSVYPHFSSLLAISEKFKKTF
jgi:hypothetical protein